eukprot:g6965.t1
MHRLPLGVCCSLALRGLGLVVPFLKRRRHNEDEDRSAIALLSRPKEEDDSTTDQARKLVEENKSGPPDLQEDPRPSTLCQSLAGSCAEEATDLAANKPEDGRKPKKAAPKNSAPEDDVAQPHAEADGKERDAGAADESETKPTPVGVPVFVTDVGESCPPGHRPMTRIECAAGPEIDGKTYDSMAGEGCTADWWPNTGCFMWSGDHRLYFSTCGRGRPQTTKGDDGTLHKGICLPSGTTSLKPILEHGKYKPEWKSLDSRPLPGWYDDAKFGLFLHWGIYSVPAHGTEWYWRLWERDPAVRAWHPQHFPTVKVYEDFAKWFTAKKFVPAEWADLFD